jgi:hypothetical protein
MARFSLTEYDQRVRVYHMKFKIDSPHLLAVIHIEDEYTIYKYEADDDMLFETHAVTFDPRYYHIMNLHEDCPGIDHIGIVHYLSGIFFQWGIHILYVNTFAYNLIFIEEEDITRVRILLHENESILFSASFNADI